MKNITKALLILPVIAFATIGCGEAKPRIETTTLMDQPQTVNCTDRLIFNNDTQTWMSRSESIEGVTPGYEDLVLSLFDSTYSKACN